MNQTLDIPFRPARSTALAYPLLWTVFVVYVLLLAWTVANHEPWGDEIHSWNISKASGSWLDLVHNSRYEGHPPGWYTVLWTISKFTHNFGYVQAVHAIIASLIVFLVLFYSPLPFFARVMIPFGYYFLYEFAVLSRNYALGILAAICICIIMRRSFRFKLPLYYLLLLVMSNFHMLSLMLAGCLHLYFLLYTIEQKGKIKAAAVHVLLGLIVFLPAVYFISPPPESQLNVGYWVDRWNVGNIKSSGQAPLRSLVPIPAWWRDSTWNTNFLLEANNKSIVLNFFVALALLCGLVYILKNNKKALAVFGANFLASMLFAIFVFPLSSARYAGFVYIGFFVAFWLYCYESKLTRTGQLLVSILLGIHIIAALISVQKDIRLTFSNVYRVNELIAKIPPNEKAVADYWAVNTISTFVDRPFYCIDMQKEISFVQWAPDLGSMKDRKYRYVDGVQKYFQQTGANRLYMISCGSPKDVFKVDPQLPKEFDVEVAYKIEGAIEKGGNLYLYKISSR